MFSPLRRSLLLATSLAAVVLLVAFKSFHLATYDLKVPFSYSEEDVVVILMYIKGLIQDGWPTTITHLSAPFTYPGAAFPMLTSVDWSIIKALSLFTSEPGYLLNGFWLLTLVFSAWTAAYATYQLGLSKILAFASGVLYAFLPFALMRSTHHLNLVYYFVPLLCLLAVLIAGGGEGIRNSRQATLAGLIACVTQGFEYIYYSFFAVLLFAIATLIAYKPNGWRQFKLPLLAAAIVILSTGLNLLPTFQSWQKDGAAPEMGYKSVKEAEVYGAKLRRMIAPHPENPILPLALFAQRDANAGFPNENENTTARLGLYGAFGLLLMMVVILRRSGGAGLPQPMMAVSALGLATFLIITVGGLGAVINLLTVPDIRAYNRFSVYLSFFAMTATGLWWQAKFGGLPSRWRVVGYFILGGFVLLSLYDQLLHAKPPVARQQNDMGRAKEERMVVENLERIFPNGTSVLELPLTGFPLLAQFNNMPSYDHGRRYIWSTHLKWSWPSFSQRHRAWQTRMGALKGDELIRAAIFSGFGAIWIDLAAYPDDGRAMVASLSLDKVKQVDIGNSRFAVLDIREMAAHLKADMTDAEFKQHTSELLDSGVLVEWKRGFYDEERTPEGRRFRWIKNNAEMVLRNPSSTMRTVCVGFDIASPTEGVVHLEGNDLPIDVKTSAMPRPVQVSLSLKPDEVRLLRFSTDLQRHNAPGDARKLYFYVMDFDLFVGENSENHGHFCSK